MQKALSGQRLYLLCILLLGAIFRFTNLNWDSYLSFHPDEGYLTQAALQVHFWHNLDPLFYVYGGLPIYLFRITANMIAFVTHDPIWTYDIAHVALAGRIVSASFSLLSIVFVFLVSKKLFSRRVGLLSAFLLAVSPWAIREAHYATSENLLVLIILSLVLISLTFLESKKLRYLVLASIFFGFAVGTKPTAYLCAIIPFAAWFVGDTPWREKFSHIPLLILSAFLGFFFTSGFTLIHLRTAFLTTAGTVADILGRHPNAFFTLQFTDTTPFLFQFQTMLWQAFLIVPVGYIGFVFLFYAMIKERVKPLMVFFAFPLFYGMSYSLWFVKFARYNDLILPFITIACSWIVSTKIKHPLVSRIAIFILMVSSLLWGIANWNIYRKPQTRIAASEWIYKMIPKGNVLCREDSDETLPVPIGNKSPDAYTIDILRMYDPESDQKMNTITSQLTRCDYLVFATRRVWGTMPKLTKRYPETSKLYEKLLTGELAFEEIQRFSSYPRIGPYAVSDETSEETYQIFDHPTVRIFRNVSDRSPE